MNTAALQHASGIRDSEATSPSPAGTDPCEARLRLCPFDPLYAPHVAAWVRTEEELTRLAPGTRWPLTAKKVLAWGRRDSRRFLLARTDLREPFAYAELNYMPGCPDQMWIGHFLLEPTYRGRSYSIRFADALLATAFLEYTVSDVLLVVFPDNTPAIRCYQRVGMEIMGTERKFFKATEREHLFLRMGISLNRYRSLVAARRLSP
ncbi:MAG: GNAT family protein [Planctomycetota bacterium]